MVEALISNTKLDDHFQLYGLTVNNLYRSWNCLGSADGPSGMDNHPVVSGDRSPLPAHGAYHTETYINNI